MEQWRNNRKRREYSREDCTHNALMWIDRRWKDFKQAVA